MSLPGPYINSDKKSFANDSVIRRWPAILAEAVDDLHRSVLEIDSSNEAKLNEGKEILRKIVALRYNIEHNREIEPMASSKEESASDVEEYNAELVSLAQKYGSGSRAQLAWHEAPWLFSECFMYRQIACYFESSTHWQDYDVFLRQKNSTFTKSADSVAELALKYRKLHNDLSSSGSDLEESVLETLFEEFLDICLWGNATDLSLLVTVSLEEIKKLQGRAMIQESKKNILANDTASLWRKLYSGRNDGEGRVDIVLDNSGFELYCDLILALFLLDSKLAKKIVFHPKSVPWFVSDVNPHDFESILSMLEDKSCFTSHREELSFLAQQVRTRMQDGSITLASSRFWTSYAPFWEIRPDGKNGGDEVYKLLKGSDLVIFKGDLNYRKLLFDLEWPRPTPFLTAIDGLATVGIPMATLRTIKADVLAGITQETETRLNNEWKESTGNERQWAYSGKYAVIQYTSGHQN